ncbi:MAG: hypothetical protein U0V70_16145 [Terriglobia bacterium]
MICVPQRFGIAFDATGQVWTWRRLAHAGGQYRGGEARCAGADYELGPTIMRWPGGGYSDSYDWRKAIGPRERRPSGYSYYGQPMGMTVASTRMISGPTNS